MTLEQLWAVICDGCGMAYVGDEDMMLTVNRARRNAWSLNSGPEKDSDLCPFCKDLREETND